jgi:hypothetical protein
VELWMADHYSSVAQGAELLLRNINRVVAWLLLLAIIVLSAVPPSSRPTMFVPRKFEHAAIFLGDGDFIRDGLWRYGSS